MVKERLRLSLCTCKAHCKPLNIATGRYEGAGRWIPRGTRDNHVKDEKRGLRQRLLTLGDKSNLLPISTPNLPIRQSPKADGGGSVIKCFEDEFLYLSSCPTTSPKTMLLFVNDPRLHEEFNLPQPSEILSGNTGKYALRPDRQVNEAFIFVENRCCNILALLDNIDVEEEVEEESRNTLAHAVFDHLVNLNHQKGVQWSQHRAPSRPSAFLVVNTGG